MSYHRNSKGVIITEKEGKFYTTKPSINGTVFTPYLEDDLTPWFYNFSEIETEERESNAGIFEKMERVRNGIWR